MPSLPVNNQSLSSQEDSYRRYFGSLKKSTPRNARALLCVALEKIIIISILLSALNFTAIYFLFKQRTLFESYHLYYAQSVAQMLITFLWCISVIYVIFKHQYANFKIMFINALLISLISLAISAYLSYLSHEKHKGNIHINTDIWLQVYWSYDAIYFCIFRFPLTLYFSILIMYVSQYCCSCPCLFIVTSRLDAFTKSSQLKDKLIDLPHETVRQETVEVFEYVASTTGTPTPYADDDDQELSLSDHIYDGGYENKERNDSTQTVTFQELEKAARSVVTRYMALYCIIFMIALFSWFVIITTDPTKYDSYRLPQYCLILLVYYVGKCGLKKSARHIDTAQIITNFSFELITEILMSTFYWINFRMFTVRYQFGDDSVWSLCGIGSIHILSEIFQDSIRMSSGYFNCTGNMSRVKKSNITQWKVRGAIDTGIRFIISVYSIIFVSIRYITDSYRHDILSRRDWRNSVILNYSVFTIELIYFLLILLKPGCAGKISDQQQINMAEPLMRIYNANRKLFLAVFCGSMAMASFLVV